MCEFPGADTGFPIGRGRQPNWGEGANVQCRRFLVKTYANTKELGPVERLTGARGTPWIRQ